MFSKELLEKEVYCIPLSNGNTLVYAPLTRFFAIYDGNITRDEIVDSITEETCSLEKIPVFVREKGFVFDTNKIRLRLNITSGCNLHCSYCSVNAENLINLIEDLPESVAFMAIRFFIDYAVKNNSKELEIVFSGGEPTLKVVQIKRIIEFAFRMAMGKDIKISPRLITNGLFLREKLSEIIHYFKEIQVSWDGEFSNHPRYGDKYLALSKQVLDNISWLLNVNIPISVLMVISDYNYTLIRRAVDTLYILGVRHIFMSLENNIGRAKDYVSVIDFDVLTSLYIELWKYYRERGIDINLGGTDVHSISPFPCSVPIPNYSVSPNGIISSCTTTFNDVSDIVNDFQIGTITSSNVLLDNESIKKMHRFQVTNIPGCSGCFIKWHCRGGCIYAKQGDWFSPLRASICSLLRNIVREKILIIINEQ